MPSILMYSVKRLISLALLDSSRTILYALPKIAKYYSTLYCNYKYQNDYYAQDPYPFVNEAVNRM